jgi:hypothetical protein
LYRGYLAPKDDDTYAGLKNDLTIATGASAGLFGTVSYNGKPIENRLAENKGEYNSDFTLNSGSYYDKVYTPYLMAESEDNFISSSRLDFTDARYRSVSLADLFPEGYRRWLANNLTGDIAIKGWAAAAENGKPVTDKDKDGNQWSRLPFGTVQWWPEQTKLCFPGDGTTICSAPENLSTFGQLMPKEVLPIDPLVGWEQQKFLIAYTMVYLPENRRQNWVDMMRLWQLGFNSDPGFANRIEYHDPTGRVWVAKTFGKETLTHVKPAKTVQKGIAARVLEWANTLMVNAYDTTAGPDLDGDNQPDWYKPVIKNGKPVVKYDPTKNNGSQPNNCNFSDNSGCKCEDNYFCEELARYNSIPAYLWEAGFVFYGSPSKKGIYE